MAAKMRCYGAVDIDMPAGPSEVLVLADKDSNPGFIAADVLAQAEHDPNAQSIVATDSEELIGEVGKEIQEQLEGLSTRKTAEKSLEHAYFVLTENREETIDFANEYASEHLEVMLKDPGEALEKIRNAGAIFLGEYSPVAAGDYASGGNHVLPTGGTARFSGPLSVLDFLVGRSWLSMEPGPDAYAVARDAVALARLEGLEGHARSASLRLGL